MDRLSPERESFLDEVVEALKQELGERLIAVVLFGSHARGEAEAKSDWDLLVLARDLPARVFPRHRFLKKMLPAMWRGSISVLAKTPTEFEASVPALYLDIALDGVILYDPTGYAEEKLGQLRALIREKGLRREQTGRDFAWQWTEFPGFNWTLDWDEVPRGV